MGDSVDTEMGAHFDALAGAVDSGLGEVTIKDLVRFDELTTTVPWRATDLTWHEVNPYSSVVSATSCREARVTLAHAHEVRAVLAVDVDHVREVVDQLRDAAVGVARAYAARVLELVVTTEPIVDGGAYGPGTVAAHLTAGRWRLIGSGPTAEETKTAGTAEVSDPDGALAGTGVQALLVDVLTGPRVEQLDTPSLSWIRGMGPTVGLVISRRFFFNAGRGTVAFT